ncbi:nucleotidyltransferase family protein [Methyloradius palustris]|uniref:Molybdopterin-guanine dinucleotide biosynthesis protein A n=1 Tax=Methyloradius palustris TaxID=2778876 RepID=A0A8D5G2Y1_9PROT|nr:nucleotidyltransferase family protein [Methyloradius palustris]BCM25073.1 molybdopterin-guanine dinucleotide biosynthesis protein A [Methyloradius palustris]
MKHIAAIILAAGSAKRFGSNKLLEPMTLDESTMPMLAHSIKPWLQVFDRINIVVNVNSDALQKAVCQALPEAVNQLRWLVCENANAGIGVSLGYGVRESVEADGWLIGLGDMPSVPAAAIREVKEALINGAMLAAPYYQKKRGHPVGLSASYGNELQQLEHDSGAKEILARDHELISHVNSDQAGICIDIDTSEDLYSYQKHLHSNSKITH